MMAKIFIIRLLDSYFRHRWLYLLPIIILTIAAGVYFATFKRLYISSGVIYAEQSTMLAALTSVQDEGFSWNTPAQDIANQFNDLFLTDAFLRAVIQETNLEVGMSKGEMDTKETIKEVRNRVWVTIAGNNQLQVNAANEDPLTAYQIAQGTINTFMQWKINLGRIDSTTAEDFLQELIMEYRADVEKAEGELLSYLETHLEPVRGDRPDIELMEIQNLQAELTFAGTRLARALEKAENARLAESQVESNVSQKYTLVDAPDIPEKPAVSRRQMAMNGSIFIAVGVLLSGIAVIGATVLDQSIRFPLDVSHELGLPVLAVVQDTSTLNQVERRWKKKKKVPAPTKMQEPVEKASLEAPIAVDMHDVELAIEPEQRVEQGSKETF